MGRTWVGQRLRPLCAGIFLALLTGCGSSVTFTEAITPTPTPTPSATATPTPVPTATPFRTPTPTPSPSPSPTPKPPVTSRFVYGTPGFEAVGIQAGVINTDGAICPVAGAPFGEGLGTPSIIQIIADTHGRFLQVLRGCKAYMCSSERGTPADLECACALRGCQAVVCQLSLAASLLIQGGSVRRRCLASEIA